MIADALGLLLRANLAGAAAILLVLLLRAPLRRVMGAHLAYRLWLLPPAVAAASLVPFPQGAVVTPIVFAGPGLWGSAAAPPLGPEWPAFVALAWGLGAAACALALVLQQARYVSALGPLSPARLGGRRVMRALRSDGGPAVVGATIVVPADFEARFTPQEQEAILAHEAQHLARGDVAANAMTSLVQCLCWFNPLVHLAARQARFDQELACDAAVIEARPALRRSYAEALLKTQVFATVPPVGCAWPARAQHPLKTRIALLGSRPPTPRRRTVGAVTLGVLLFTGGYAAWAAQPGQGRTITQPDWVERPTGLDMVRFYPAGAVKRNLEGEAVMQCRVEVSGALSACSVQRQAPAGAGFGEAALRMTPLFRMKPTTRDGVPVAGGRVRIPVAFRIAKPQPQVTP